MEQQTPNLHESIRALRERSQSEKCCPPHHEVLFVMGQVADELLILDGTVRRHADALPVEPGGPRGHVQRYEVDQLKSTVREGFDNLRKEIGEVRQQVQQTDAKVDQVVEGLKERDHELQLREATLSRKTQLSIAAMQFIGPGVIAIVWGIIKAYHALFAGATP